jgi:hypothetical protein
MVIPPQVIGDWILQYPFEKVFLPAAGWGRVGTHETVPLPTESFQNSQNPERTRANPTASLAGVTGGRLVPNLGGMFRKTYNGMERIFHINHAGKVNILVTSETARVLPEEGH